MLSLYVFIDLILDLVLTHDPFVRKTKIVWGIPQTKWTTEHISDLLHQCHHGSLRVILLVITQTA